MFALRIALSWIVVTAIGSVPSVESADIAQSVTLAASSGAAGDECPAETLAVLLVDEQDLPIASDPFDVVDAAIDGDTLRLRVSYGGGCEPHTFAVSASRQWTGDSPVTTNVVIAHDAHGDMCQAAITNELLIDLSELKRAYLDANPGTDSGEISLVLLGKDRSVLYSF